MRNKSTQRNRRETRQAKPAAARAEPAARHRGLLLLGVVLCVLAAVVVMQWNAGLWRGHSDRPPKVETLPPGAPPIDAAAVLKLSSTLPNTVKELKAEATQVTSRLTQQFPQRPEAHARQALLRAESGAEGEALISWEHALQCDDKFVAAYLGIGTIRASRAEFAESATMLQKALDLDPSAPLVYRELVDVLLKNNDTERAEKVARAFTERFPDLADAHFWLGQTQLQLGDFAAAQQSHLKATRANPTWSQPYSSLAQACARLGKIADARQYRLKFAELKKAEVDSDRQQTRAYDDVQRQRSVTANTHIAAAGMQLRFGQVQNVEAHWLRASQIAPDDTQSRTSLVAFYTQHERPAAAVKILDELARIEPDNPQHLVDKASHMIDMGQWLEARPILQQVLTAHRDLFAAELLLAKSYLALGDDPGAARRHAERAVALSKTPQAYMILATVQQQAGDLPAARTTLGKAVAAEPNNLQLRQAYEQLKD